jgi:hypothetical protein
MNGNKKTLRTLVQPGGWIKNKAGSIMSYVQNSTKLGAVRERPTVDEAMLMAVIQLKRSSIIVAGAQGEGGDPVY